MTSHERDIDVSDEATQPQDALADRILALEQLVADQARTNRALTDTIAHGGHSSTDLLMLDLPTKFGLRDESKWLIRLLRDVRSDSLDVVALELRILGRLKLLSAKDTWDEGTCERIANALDAQARSISCEDDIDAIVAKAKSKGFRRSGGGPTGNRGKRKARGRGRQPS